MAESQDFFNYTPELHTELETALSSARLARYLASDAQGDPEMAIKLYLWNARIAKSFLYPLQMVEIVARNAIHRAFSSACGDSDWMRTQDGEIYSRLHHESQASIERAISRLKRNTKRSFTSDDIVAGLTFDFWFNLFRAENN